MNIVLGTTKTELMKEPLYGSVKEEIADVLKNVIYILNALKYPIPIETLIRKKCELDEIEYPVKKFMGRHRYQVFTKEREYSFLLLANLTPLWRKTSFQSIKFKRQYGILL